MKSSVTKPAAAVEQCQVKIKKIKLLTLYFLLLSNLEKDST